MLTANIDVSDGLVNGVTGKVTSIFHGSMPSGQPEAICILFDDSRVGREWRKKNPPPHNVNKSSIVIHAHKEIYRIRLHHITRRQYPLKLAWGLTIHKVQGMTMKKNNNLLKRYFSTRHGLCCTQSCHIIARIEYV